MIQFLIALITTLVIVTIPVNKFNLIIDEIQSEIKEIKQENSVQIDSVYDVIKLNSVSIDTIYFQLIEIQADSFIQ